MADARQVTLAPHGPARPHDPGDLCSRDSARRTSSRSASGPSAIQWLVDLDLGGFGQFTSGTLLLDGLTDGAPVLRLRPQALHRPRPVAPAGPTSSSRARRRRRSRPPRLPSGGDAVSRRPVRAARRAAAAPARPRGRARGRRGGAAAASRRPRLGERRDTACGRGGRAARRRACARGPSRASASTSPASACTTTPRPTRRRRSGTPARSPPATTCCSPRASYRPGTPAGRELLLHELAHVAQQREEGARVTQHQPEPRRTAGSAAPRRTPTTRSRTLPLTEGEDAHVLFAPRQDRARRGGSSRQRRAQGLPRPLRRGRRERPRLREQRGRPRVQRQPLGAPRGRRARRDREPCCRPARS